MRSAQEATAKTQRREGSREEKAEELSVICFCYLQVANADAHFANDKSQMTNDTGLLTVFACSKMRCIKLTSTAGPSEPASGSARRWRKRTSYARHISRRTPGTPLQPPSRVPDSGRGKSCGTDD